MRKKNDSKNLGGFTIVELLIASAVFSLVLLVALTGFLELGRIFYKGVSNTQTQDVLRQVVGDISSNVKIASSSGSVQPPATTTTGAYGYLCAGTYRYTYGFYKNSSASAPGRPIAYNATTSANYDPGTVAPSFGLLKDRLPGEGTCPGPCVSSAGSPSSVAACNSANCGSQGCLALDTNNPTEMLASGMRLGSISLTGSPGSDLYNLGVTIAYGDNTVLGYSASNIPFCTGGSASQKFCAVDQLSTTIFRGELHP
jgi:type II secretory pathway pseudopilin PulG